MLFALLLASACFALPIHVDRQNAPAAGSADAAHHVGFFTMAEAIALLAKNLPPHEAVLLDLTNKSLEVANLTRPVTLELLSYEIVARDGVSLWTWVWIPTDNAGPVSATMCRSPYATTTCFVAIPFCIDGYVAVMQHQRGSGRSGGDFSIWRKDGEDGYDTMEWIAAQPWSNGKVFAMGASADGNAAATLSLVEPPWLKAGWLIWYAVNAHETTYPGGAYRQNLIDNWMRGVCPECIAQMKENEPFSEWWDPITGDGKYFLVNAPAVSWAGWYDIFLKGTIDGFNGAQYESADGARGKQFLVVDVGGHCTNTYNQIAGRSALPLILAFSLLAAADSGNDTVTPYSAINLFVMGPDDGPRGRGNYWTTIPDWPSVTRTRMYLTPSGTLSTTVPVTSSSFSYNYDPLNPVPTIGGNELFGGCGPQNQVSVESRDDVVVFTSDVLSSDIALTGSLSVVLYVSTDRNDTDFTAKLTDVYEDGRSLLVIDGITRMRWRLSNTDPTPALPGVVYEITIDLEYTSFIFNSGHRIRLAISSSNAPRFSANPNNGLAIDETGPIYVAHNTIFVGAGLPSALILPVVDVADLPPSDILASLAF